MRECMYAYALCMWAHVPMIVWGSPWYNFMARPLQALTPFQTYVAIFAQEFEILSIVGLHADEYDHVAKASWTQQDQ